MKVGPIKSLKDLEIAKKQIKAKNFEIGAPQKPSILHWKEMNSRDYWKKVTYNSLLNPFLKKISGKNLLFYLGLRESSMYFFDKIIDKIKKED